MRKDYLQTENGDIDISSGDFTTVESDEQHVHDLLMVNKGGMRTNPAVGVGIRKYVKGSVAKLPQLKREIIVAVKEDDYDNIVVDLKNGIEKLKITYR